MRRLLLIVPVLAACGGTYDPPPELASVNVDGGLYDPAGGPLEVVLTEPVVTSTLAVSLVTARWSPERDLCVADGGGALPDGCREAAEVVARWPGDTAISLYERRSIRMDLADRLTPFSRYVVVLDAGLADDAGRARGVPLLVPFQVAGSFATAPTDFEEGMFFAVLEVIEPLPTRVHFFFWLAVDEATGRLRLFGTDADPADPSVKESDSTDLRPASWAADPSPPNGFSVEPTGQVAETAADRVVVLYPFDLEVPVPPVQVTDAEFRGTVRTAEIPDGPSGEREVIEGQLNSPKVLLGLTGEMLDMGPGRGQMMLFRLTDDEAPPLSAILPAGRSEADVEGAFAPQ